MYDAAKGLIYLTQSPYHMISHRLTVYFMVGVNSKVMIRKVVKVCA